jgi:endonuclease III
MKESKQQLDAQALEASLPSLTKKLKELQKGLSKDEQAVFSSIINSAAIHLESTKAIEATAEIIYSKPISAVASVGVRKTLMKLPKTLGLDK